MVKLETKSKHVTWAVLKCVIGCTGVMFVEVEPAWLFEMERRRGESFLCLQSPTVLPFSSPSKPIFWFWPGSSRVVSLSLRLPLRRPPEPRFSVGSRLCFSTGHSWFPFTQAQSTLYLLRKFTKRHKRNQQLISESERILVFYCGPAGLLILSTHQLP